LHPMSRNSLPSQEESTPDIVSCGEIAR
jgi:hypothetical protein